ncbi:MAG TPA: ATP-binding protein [Thermoanaerobaculia bacterium]|nr:ATP-binding protein [Thermoanaerobaculia bacterium]
MNPWGRAAVVAGALAVLLWADGWFARTSAVPPAGPPPADLRDAFSRAAADLSGRAGEFSGKPEVSRSLQGGGIAVDRVALFAAARQALEGAPPGCWVALADRSGNVHAWWGEAPSPVPRALQGEGFSALWSATSLTLIYRRSAGAGPQAGVVSVARSFPVRAPDFAASLGLEGRASPWRPVGRPGAPALFQSGGATIGAVAAVRASEMPAGRSGILIALGVAALFGFARSSRPPAAGLWLALLFLALAMLSSEDPRVLASPSLWPMVVGVASVPLALAALRGDAPAARRGARTAAGYLFLVLSFFAATRVEPPELGAFGPEGWTGIVDIAGLLALLVTALAFRAAGAPPGPSPRRWLTAAVFFTTAVILGDLAILSAAPTLPALLFLLMLATFELWVRSAGSPGREIFLLPRLLAGAALLLVLAVSSLREHALAAEAFRVTSLLRLPDPDHPSTSAVVAAQQAADRMERFDLERDLPAPPEDTDLSDLAYRIWRDGAEGPEGRALASYEISDANGRPLSRFSLIPEAERPGELSGPTLTIDRFRVAVVRRDAALHAGTAVVGSGEVVVADWPTWDPLPPRIGVYRRLVLGRRDSGTAAPASRPLLAVYDREGELRDEGPSLPAAIRARLRGAEHPIRVRLPFRGTELLGEVRPLREGYGLVAIPVPRFFDRVLTAALLLPPIALVLAAAAVLRGLAAMARPGARWKPAWAQTFRGRLVALFVLGVLAPLFAVSFFLRSQIEIRSRRDTLEHARTALETARRVLDDYLPSAAAARGRLGLLDDTLIAWLANAVGYDLSVYGPDGGLVATSRRDLYASGLVPDRAPASVYVSVGLSGARQQTGSRRVAGSRFEEVTTALSALPGVPGLSSPGLLSLLLLPQQQIAAAEAAQWTAAVWAFSALVFLLSAAVAGRLAVRVARPVADLVEGTRAVSRGDFSPHLEEPPDEELKELVRAFLSMSRSLRDQTEAVSREKERLATLLSNLTAGVVALGEGGRVLLANPAAVALGGGSADAATVERLFPGEPMRVVRAVLRETPQRPIAAEVEPRRGERWRIVSVPLPPGGEGDRMAVIEDVSDVVRSNRLAAWAEMARIIAHEIKNPLTPIRLSVEHLREVWRRRSPDFDRVLEECVSNVLRQTEELRRSAAEFADYARLPGPDKRRVDLSQAVRDAAAAFAGAPGVRWVVDARPDAVVEADPRLLARVLSNLLGNAVEALGTGGGEIAIRVEDGDRRVRVTIEDDGPGVSPEVLPRLFEPYFSARSGGTGLGLAIVKKIVEEHGGEISAENRAPGGFRVRFDLPRPESSGRAPA